MQDKILLFIPAYNCSPQIPRVLRKLNEIPAGTFAEVLVLDNQSPDNTGAVAVAILPEITSAPVTVGRNQANYGLGGSHKVAFGYAQRNGFTHVVVLHGDDQGDLHDLMPILAAGQHRKSDACLGSRFMRGSSTPGYSTFRTFGNHVFNLLFSAAAAKHVTDLGSGLNIFGPAVIHDESVRRFSDDLRFNCYMLLSLVDKNRSFFFFPITWREEDQISNVKMFRQTLLTLEIVREYVFKRFFFRNADHRTAKHALYDFNTLATTRKESAV
ncbi:MAG: glycosyltransferase family 2 protein [Acidobacteriaceae bacterium]|nr:glycosyltransferase family 2 protein [Acidobacteriaceae bacterium]